MAYSTSALLAKIESMRTNPAQMQRAQLEALEAVMDGTLDIVDATNPFIFLLESHAVTAAATMSRVEAVTRRLYPSLAATDDDLYRHMSDVDYLGRFGLPDKATMVLALRWSEVLNQVVPVPDSDVKKLVIPRNTSFTVDGIPFGMQYPIEIRLMPHGGFQVVYLNDIPSPLWDLTTNLVPWTRTPMMVDGTYDTWMMIPIETRQFKLTTNDWALSSTTGFNRDIALTDNYYYCRVYGLNPDGVTWTEYLTTHSDQVYDAKTVTVKLKVTEGKLNVYVPQIYFSSNMLGASLRVDVYTTKGPLGINLGEYQPSQFEMNCIDLDTESVTAKYFAPIPTITGTIYSTSKTSGGANAIPFENLREQVIMNSTYVKTPITQAQLDTSQQINGFNILKSKDNITSRLYAGSKALPVPSEGILKAGAGTMMGMLETSMADLVSRSTVVDNGTSVTITPNSLFEVRNNVLNIMSEADYQTIIGQWNAKNWDDLLVNIENKGREVVYTPFHYVLDTANNRFDMRAYHLASPVITNRNFVAENPTTLLSCGTGDVSLFRTDTGYRLVVITESGETYKQLTDAQTHLQLAYKAVGEDDYAYMTGKQIGLDTNGERVWEFIIDTTYYLNGNDQIQLKDFSMYDGNLIRTFAELSQQMYLVWSVSGYDVNDMENSDIDKLVYKQQVPTDSIGVTQESLVLSFGTALTWLWRRARTVKDSVTYKTYDADVIKTYTTDQYATDADGTPKLVLNPSTGKYDFVVTHHAGEVVLDANGNPTYLHRKNDPVMVNGEPVEEGPRAVVRHIDLMLVDGRFYFATEPNDMAYKIELANSVVGYLSDIADINDKLLENTELYYVPTTTLGDINVLIGAGVETTISSTQSFVIRLYMNQTNYNNQVLKDSLEDKTNTIVHETLVPATFSVDGLASLVKDTLGDDVMAVDADPIGANKDLSVFTAMDDITRCSVKRKLVVLPENVLQVQDDILVDFVRHQRSAVSTANTYNE